MVAALRGAVYGVAAIPEAAALGVRQRG